MVPAERIKSDACVVEVLCIERAGVRAGFADLVHGVSHGHDKPHPPGNELLIDLPDDVRRDGVRIFAVVGGVPLRVRDDAEAPRLSKHGGEAARAEQGERGGYPKEAGEVHCGLEFAMKCVSRIVWGSICSKTPFFP